MKRRHLVLALTGASGVIYGLRLAEELLRADIELTMLISRAGFMVLEEEVGVQWQGSADETLARLKEYFRSDDGRLRFHSGDNLSASIASGSAAPDAMVVCPCSMGTLARIACGISATLLERTADVMIKEKRPLLLVPRETPLSEIHLENMLKLSRMGVTMVPAMPGFYGHPETMADLVNFVVGKALDQLGMDHHLYKRWRAQV
jgi:4-hydroxy-3-polyprenylbenzoate decarboxylase